MVLGQESRSEYLLHGQPGYFTPYYAAAQFVNEELPKNSRILFFEESRGYYFERDFVATSFFAPNPFVAFVNQSTKPGQLRDYLTKEGITHVFLNRAEMFRGGGKSPFSKEGALIFDAFAGRYLRKLFQKVTTSPPGPLKDRQWVEVYELVRGSGPNGA